MAEKDKHKKNQRNIDKKQSKTHQDMTRKVYQLRKIEIPAALLTNDTYCLPADRLFPGMVK